MRPPTDHPDYDTVQQYLESLSPGLAADAPPPAVLLSDDQLAQINSLDNFIAFNPIDWDQLPPTNLANAYVAVVQGNVPYADGFLDQVEAALAVYDLPAVLPPAHLAALRAAADRPAGGPRMARVQNPNFRAALVPPAGPCLVNPPPTPLVPYWSPDAQRVKPYDGPSAGALTAADLARSRRVFDDQGNRIPPPSLQIVMSAGTAGPFASLAGVMSILQGDTPDRTLQVMQSFEAVDGAVAALAATGRPVPTVAPGNRRSAASLRRPVPAGGRPSAGQPAGPRPRPAATRPVRLPTLTPSQFLGKAANDNAGPPAGLFSPTAANDNAVGTSRYPKTAWTYDNGYWFTEWTDARGYRYKRATGALQNQKGTRNNASHKAVSGGTGDHAGHAIGNQFNGPDIAANLDAQNWIQNTGKGTEGTYHKMESGWKKRLNDGARVAVDVVTVYKPGESRPFMRKVDWVETGADGSRATNSLSFANTQTPESRLKRNVPPTPQPRPAPVIPLPGAASPAAPRPLSANAQQVLGALGSQPRSATELMAPSALSTGQYMAALRELEAAGLAVETTGGTSFTEWRRR